MQQFKGVGGILLPSNFQKLFPENKCTKLGKAATKHVELYWDKWGNCSPNGWFVPIIVLVIFSRGSFWSSSLVQCLVTFPPLQVPADWRDEIIITPYKREGSKNECGNYCPHC